MRNVEIIFKLKHKSIFKLFSIVKKILKTIRKKRSMYYYGRRVQKAKLGSLENNFLNIYYTLLFKRTKASS